MEQNLTKQIDIFSILRDVLHEWATILLFAVSVSLLTNVAVVQTYQPEYTAKAIFTVSAKSTNNTIYQDLSQNALHSCLTAQCSKRPWQRIWDRIPSPRRPL